MRKADSGLKMVVPDALLLPVAESLAPAKQTLLFSGRPLSDDEQLGAVRRARRGRPHSRPKSGRGRDCAEFGQRPARARLHGSAPQPAARPTPGAVQVGVRHDEQIQLAFESPCTPETLRKIRDPAPPKKGKGKAGGGKKKTK